MTGSAHESLTPLEESATDAHETWMTYDSSGRMPIYVVLVWIVAMVGLGAYLARYYFPDLALWMSP